MARQEGHSGEHTCPICGKIFYPAPYHQLEIGYSKASKLVCSYTCMRKWEKEKIDKRKTKLSDKEKHDE